MQDVPINPKYLFKKKSDSEAKIRDCIIGWLSHCIDAVLDTTKVVQYLSKCGLTEITTENVDPYTYPIFCAQPPLKDRELFFKLVNALFELVQDYPARLKPPNPGYAKVAAGISPRIEITAGSPGRPPVPFVNEERSSRDPRLPWCFDRPFSDVTAYLHRRRTNSKSTTMINIETIVSDCRQIQVPCNDRVARLLLQYAAEDSPNTISIGAYQYHVGMYITKYLLKQQLPLKKVIHT
jgi:hypothetical protein